MVAVKAAEVARRFPSADTLPAVTVVHGNDRGLVAETAASLAQIATRGSEDPLGLIKLGPEDLSADPGRIIDEARTIALFGGRRTIWVRGAPERAIVTAVTALLEEPPVDAVVVVEMDELKKSSPLRKAAESSPHAAAVVCYADSERDLERLFDDAVRSAGVAVDSEARALALSLIGGDRMASRSEIEKLLLYAHGAERLTVSHVGAIVGDVAAHDAFDVIDAAFLGRLDELAGQLRGVFAAGVNPGYLTGQALRWTHGLERARCDVDAGATPARAVDRMIPPVIFFRRTTVTRTLSLWPAAPLRRAAEWLGETVLSSRRQPANAQAILEKTLLRIGYTARRLAG